MAFLYDTLTQRDYDLSKLGERITIVRLPNNDVVSSFNFKEVSREHAMVLRKKGVFYIQDLDSRNGTYLKRNKNQERLPRRENIQLKDGDEIYLGEGEERYGPLIFETRGED